METITELTLEQLIVKKKDGDYVKGSQKLGITPDNFRQAINRIGSKYHNDAVQILEEVIYERENKNK